MSAAEHPSQKTRPCWCNTNKAKYGCYTHGPTPLERDHMADCRTCPCVTKNVNPRLCDVCVGRLEHAAAELDTPEIHGLLNQFDWFGDVA